MRTKRLALVAVCACLAAACFAAPAGADARRWGDRGDGRGPLALRGVEVGHDRWGSPTVTVSFENPISPATFGRRDFFVVQLEGVGRPTVDYSYYFGAFDGRWVTYGYDERERQVVHGGYYFRMPSSRQVRIWLGGEPWYYPETGGHRFRVASNSRSGACAGGCWDVLPRRGWLVHDYTPPDVLRWQLPPWVLTTDAEPEIPISWRVRDIGLSKLRDVTLWKRSSAGGEWEQVESRSSGGRVDRRLPAEQGAHVWFRLTARDHSGNETRTHALETRVPFDDTSSEHAAAYFGLWEEESHVDTYLNTLHVSSTSVDTFSFTAEARHYCIVYRRGPDYGDATLEMDGEEHTLYMNFPVTSIQPHCLDAGSRALREIVVRPRDGGVINVDGFWSG